MLGSIHDLICNLQQFIRVQPAMEKRESNYEITKHRMEEKFASYDMADICREWELELKDGAVKVTLLGTEYLIVTDSGAVMMEQDGVLKEADFNVSMTLFDILTRRRQYASGEMVSVSALSAHTFNGSRFFSRALDSFEHRCEDLSDACRKLGGVPYGKGDVSYLLPVFRDLMVAVSFWDSDDEFGPELSFLCDGNILAYMHFETVMFLLSHIAGRLRELMP